MTEIREALQEKSHLSVEDIAAYLNGRLYGAAREAFESHLAECRQCRDEVTAARRMMSERNARQRHWILPALSAAALLIAISLKSPVSNVREQSTRSGKDAGSSIATFAPSREGSAASLHFIWRDIGRDVLYQLTLSDTTGAAVWETQTRDTSVSLPSDIKLAVGASYLWSVDASMPDGTHATSGIKSFTTRQ